MKTTAFLSQYSKKKKSYQTKYKAPFISVYMSRAEHIYTI